jgi:hypothetical protein
MPAFINMMMRKPLALCLQDEFGAFLRRANNKKETGFETNITKSMREWGISAARYDGPEEPVRDGLLASYIALCILDA